MFRCRLFSLRTLSRRFCTSVIVERAPGIVATEGNPAREIARFADQTAADLLVMGRHGRGGFERLFHRNE